MIRVVVVDDSEIVRRGFRVVLRHADDIEIVGEARNGHEAIALAQELNPDVMTMDIQMPGLNGLKATQQIVLRRANVRIVMVSSSYDEYTVRQALEMGATGYVAKPEVFDELVPAIRAAYKNRGYQSGSVPRVAVHGAETFDGHSSQNGPPVVQ